jgi:hypothetical protein
MIRCAEEISSFVGESGSNFIQILNGGIRYIELHISALFPFFPARPNRIQWKQVPKVATWVSIEIA